MPYLVAEMGCNHDGDLDRAKEIIKMCRDAGVDAVKGQKRHIPSMNRDVLDAPYDSPNAYGRTYREHREALEFTPEQHFELYQFAEDLGIDYSVSVWDLRSLEDVAQWVPWIKIPSAKCLDSLLISRATETGVPVWISDGATTSDDRLQLFGNPTLNVNFLLCTAIYPTPLDRIGMRSVRDLYVEEGEIYDGISGHWDPECTIPDVMAVALGLRWIERHVTLDRNDKGSDHSLSMDPPLIRKWVESIRQAQQVISSPKTWYPEEFEKMKRLR